MTQDLASGGETAIQILNRNGPVSAALHSTMCRLEEFLKRDLLDEESITMFILSGVTVATPLLISLLGSGQAESRQCSWGAFNKYGGTSDPKSETTSGADFVLIIGRPKGLARVALFQAKKFDLGRASGLDVRRDAAGSAEEKRQLVMLMAFGIYLLGQNSTPRAVADVSEQSVAVLQRATYLSKADPAFRKEAAESLTWIHYLAYDCEGAICLPMSGIGSKAIEAEFKGGDKVRVSADSKTPSLLELLNSGLSGDGKGWWDMDRATLNVLLPELVELFPVIIADDEGRGGLEIGKEIPADDKVIRSVAGAEPIIDALGVLSENLNGIELEVRSQGYRQ